MRKQLIKTVETLLNQDSKTVLLLGDIGVHGFRNSLSNISNRTYNIGILEQSTIGLSCGLSKTGLIPFVHTIAPFLVERSYEQLKIDFGYEKLNGNFITIGSSYDYASLGATHHCPADVPILLNIPNFQIIVPGTSIELDTLMMSTYNNGNPTYFRLSEYENKISQDVVFGKANVIKKGKNATIICVGNTLQNVLDATKDLDVTILYYTTIHPFDSEVLKENFNEKIILVEPYYMGALNFQVSNVLKDKKFSIYNIGIPRKFLYNYGTKEEHDINIGLDKTGIEKSLKEWI
jgi:transketolase